MAPGRLRLWLAFFSKKACLVTILYFICIILAAILDHFRQEGNSDLLSHFGRKQKAIASKRRINIERVIINQS